MQRDLGIRARARAAASAEIDRMRQEEMTFIRPEMERVLARPTDPNGRTTPGNEHATMDSNTPPDRGDIAMSTRALIWVAELKVKGLTWAERALLLKLANHANKAGKRAFPSVTTMAEWADKSERTIQNTLLSLINKKLIKVEDDKERAGGHKRPTTYEIAISSDYDPGSKTKGGVQDLTEGGVQDLTKRGVQDSAPEPVLSCLNLSKEEPSVLPHGPLRGPRQAKPALFDQFIAEATPILCRLTGCYRREAKKVLTDLVALYGRDCRAAMFVMRELERVNPTDPIRWLNANAGKLWPPPPARPRAPTAGFETAAGKVVH